MSRGIPHDRDRDRPTRAAAKESLMSPITRITAVAVALSAGALTLVIAPSAARAGDPCPIRFAAVDLGVPGWAEPALRKRVEGGDPLLARMVSLAGKLECGEVSLAPAKDGSIAVALHEEVAAARMKLDHVKARLVDEKRRFRCDAAARDLKYLAATAEEDGMVLWYRGHGRILLVSPGWKSLCVDAARADKMTDEQLVGLWKKVTGPRVADRHANP